MEKIKKIKTCLVVGGLIASVVGGVVAMDDKGSTSSFDGISFNQVDNHVLDTQLASDLDMNSKALKELETKAEEINKGKVKYGSLGC